MLTTSRMFKPENGGKRFPCSFYKISSFPSNNFTRDKPYSRRESGKESLIKSCRGGLAWEDRPLLEDGGGEAMGNACVSFIDAFSLSREGMGGANIYFSAIETGTRQYSFIFPVIQ